MAAGSDAMAVAEATGLAPRAAEWAAFAALHSGCFTRPQAAAWIGAEPETSRRTASRVVASLCKRDLATEDELGGIGKVVHIHAKQVYRALGEPDNRNRRKPAREKALERLLCLDYVLDHPDERWLPTEAAKTAACEAAGIDQSTWPSKLYPAQGGTGETTRYFVEKFPLAIDPDGNRAVVACASPGTTTARLEGWLGKYGPFIRALGAGRSVELVHIAACTALSDAAGKALANAAAHLAAVDEDAATIERIKAAIRADTDEALESIGGIEHGLDTAREIYGRRGKEFSAATVEVQARTWTTARIALPERAG